MNHRFLVVDQNVPDGRETLHDLLRDYNLRNGPPPNNQLLGILLKDEDGRTIGGLWGASRYEWLFVDMLFVPEHLRGHGVGTALMRQAEDIARARGCTGVWLDTFDFQALGFYQKLGYTLFGELKDHPRGISQHWLQHRFDKHL
jgi:GNAT superfamily N-acetyltransferase